MIRFNLKCEKGHAFDAWFSSSGDFDSQAERGLVTCPHCGSAKVEKALMAPAVSHGTRRGEERPTLAMDSETTDRIRKIKELVAAVRANSEDVGDRFAEEARKIHYGESDPRGIIGRADLEDAKALAEEGIAFAPLPSFPDDAN